MSSTIYAITGNICAERIKAGRALHTPPLTQKGLADQARLLGLEHMSVNVLSRIENNRRHVYDAELRVLAKALDVSMAWLVGCTDVYP